MVVIPELPREKPARDGENRRDRGVQLGWTDPESGEELAIEMWGAEDFLSELLALGFVVLEPDPGAASVDGTGAGKWMGESCAGANLASLRARSSRREPAPGAVSSTCDEPDA